MMTRYIKVVRDLTTDIPKSMMLILAIAIGIFGVGTILGAYEVLTREMKTNYMGTNPASATIEIEGNISEQLLDRVKQFPGIKVAERRATHSARMKVDGQWFPLLLFVIDDFEHMNISKVHRLTGSPTPEEGCMLIERTAPSVMHAYDGDSLIVKTTDGEQKIKITGIVHDPALAPAWQQQTGYGYITMATLQKLGVTQGFNLLRIQVSENEFSRDHITKVAEQLSDWIKKQGSEIREIQVPTPVKHPHQSQMTAILSIFTVFSFMILGLGSILVATTMATMMVKQVRQIGVMKTIGGTTGQIARMYFVMILTYSVAALLIGIPLSRIAAYEFSKQIAILLNMEITDSSIPFVVLVIQVASGVLMPMLVTSIPLIRGSSITIRRAFDNYGTSSSRQRTTAWLFYRVTISNDALRLALRNAFRQRSRLVLTILLLAAGGAMFMTALNVSDAWDVNLKRIYSQRLYDQEIRLSERIEPDSLFEMIRGMKGIKIVEGWDYSPTSFISDNDYEITQTYPDKGHGSFSMLALPVNSTLLKPTLQKGEWLKDEGTHHVVLNQMARGSDMKIGDEVRLSIEGKRSNWKVIGFTEDIGSSATAYVSIETFMQLNKTKGKVGTLRIAFTDRSMDFAWQRNRDLEQLLEREHVSVDSSTPVWLIRNAVAAHMKVLVNSLLAMAMMMALVGTLGLTSTISMSVLERTREIGVMRAIGATPNKIKRLIIMESLTIGLLSMILAFAVSLLLSYFMGRFIGEISFRTPLTLTISATGVLIWFAIVVGCSYLASVLPARKANGVTTREALAYE